MTAYEQTNEMLQNWRDLRAKLRLFEASPAGASYAIAILVLNVCIIDAEQMLLHLTPKKDVEKEGNESKEP